MIAGVAPPTFFNGVSLHLPPELASAEEIELVDPEGAPLARVTPQVVDGEVWGWQVAPLGRPSYGPFRRLRLTADEVQERFGDAIRVPVEEPLTVSQLGELSAADTDIVLLLLAGVGWPTSTTPLDLVRSTLEATREFPHVHAVVVPLARHDHPDTDADLRERALAAYTGEGTLIELPAGDGPLAARVASGAPSAPGVVVLFTGLSGSGKSTIARALTDHVLETTGRTVTSLDGDVVRRHLSAGLTFSPADRETNIRRIGWVAAEVARHGGLAICSPIAPYAATRDDVRRMVTDAGGELFLVHVATPVEECERRDRKGLYAKARAGEIPDFTGISAPYEEPTDADVVVDTTGRSVDDALDDVLAGLERRGLLTPVVEEAGHGRLETPGSETVVSRRPQAASSTTGAPATLPPLKVLVVCTANICRSPYMELVLREQVGDAVEVVGAGTHGFTQHPMDEQMAAQARDRGLDPTEFRSRPLTRQLVDEADLVLTAESRHRSYILDEQPGAFRKVFTLGQFARGVAQVGAADLPAREVVALIGANRPAADPAVDVSDPYRRGPEAAAACASYIDGLVTQIAPALGRR